jgi:hypothetical protein
MEFEITSRQQALHAEIVEFIRHVLNQGALERDQACVFDRDLWRRCGLRL